MLHGRSGQLPSKASGLHPPVAKAGLSPHPPPPPPPLFDVGAWVCGSNALSRLNSPGRGRETRNKHGAWPLRALYAYSIQQAPLIALLASLFLLVYLLVYAGALAGEALSYDASLQWLMQRAWRDFLTAAPWATIGAAVWIVIAYYFHQNIVDAVTGGHAVTRKEEPRLYNLLKICASRAAFHAGAESDAKRCAQCLRHWDERKAIRDHRDDRAPGGSTTPRSKRFSATS